MITEEQIKKLKPGDPVIIEATFCKIDYVGDVVSVTKCTSRGEIVDGAFFAATSHVSLPPEKPKYDPTRPYQKGDLAQVVERNGRNVTCFPSGRIKVSDIVTVAENESGDVFIKVLTDAGHEMMVPWFMLELVKPVEEQLPYVVRHNEAHAAWSIYGPYNLSAVNYFYGDRYPYTKEQAKAAAEAEAARLNDEWRKKVGTEVPCSDGKEENND